MLLRTVFSLAVTAIPVLATAQAVVGGVAGASDSNFPQSVNSSTAATLQTAIDAIKAQAQVMVQGVITGHVSDSKTGRPVSGASVSLGTVSERGVTTGEDGVYRLIGVATGAHTVTVRILGYAKQTKRVTVIEGTTQTVDFKLEPSASVLDQVIVTGTIHATARKAVPTSITVVTARDIEEKGIKSIDQLFRGEIPGAFVQEVPGGGSFNQLGRSVMVMRGATMSPPNGNPTLSPAPIKTYVDGVELADPGFLNTIDPKSIERIEIISGPQASTVYGSGAISGVMQVFTKKGTGSTKPQATLALQSGVVQSNISSSLTPQHDHSLQVVGGDQQTSYSVGAGYAYLGEWSPGYSPKTLSGYGSVRHMEGVVTAEASARMAKRTTGALSTATTAFRQVRISNGLLTYSPSFIINQETHPTVWIKTLGLTTSANLRPNWQNRLTVGNDESNALRLQHTPTYRNSTDTLYSINDDGFRKFTVSYSTTLVREFGGAMSGSLTAGADLMQYKTNSMSSIRFTNTVGSLTATLNPTISRNQETNKGYYAQGQLSIKEALFLTAGIRKEDNTNYGNAYTGGWAPRYGLSIVRDIGQLTTKVRAAYGRATRTPAPGIADAVASADAAFPQGTLTRLANTHIQPEQQYGPEYGVEFYLGDRASLQITRYDQTTEDLIALIRLGDTKSILPDATVDCGTPSSDGFCYLPLRQNQNIGKLRNRGWETQGDFRLSDKLSLGGTWSYTKSRIPETDPGYVCANRVAGHLGTCIFPGQSFYDFAEHTGAGRFTYRDDKNTASVSLSFIGQRMYRQNSLISVVGSDARLKTELETVDTRSNPLVAPGYHKVDIQLNRSIGKRVTLVLGMANALNETDSKDIDPLNESATIGRSTSIAIKWVL